MDENISDIFRLDDCMENVSDRYPVSLKLKMNITTNKVKSENDNIHTTRLTGAKLIKDSIWEKLLRSCLH